jgi:hypothetical protein
MSVPAQIIAWTGWCASRGVLRRPLVTPEELGGIQLFAEPQSDSVAIETAAKGERRQLAAEPLSERHRRRISSSALAGRSAPLLRDRLDCRAPGWVTFAGSITILSPTLACNSHPSSRFDSLRSYAGFRGGRRSANSALAEEGAWRRRHWLQWQRRRAAVNEGPPANMLPACLATHRAARSLSVNDDAVAAVGAAVLDPLALTQPIPGSVWTRLDLPWAYGNTPEDCLCQALASFPA